MVVPNRFDVLEAAMAKVAKKGAVPADKYAAQLVGVTLKRRLPRWGLWGVCGGGGLAG